MIKSFRCKETARIFSGKVSRHFPQDIQQRALNKLRLLHAARDLSDLVNPPSNRFKALQGDRAGSYSIRINDQWRICFRWAEGAADVEITDYH